MIGVKLWCAGRNRYKNPLGNDILNLFCSAGMYDAVMPSAGAVAQQAGGTVSSSNAVTQPVTQPTNTVAVGNLSAAPTAALANSASSQNAGVTDSKDQASSQSRDRDRRRDRSRSRDRSRRDRSRSRCLLYTSDAADE